MSDVVRCAPPTRPSRFHGYLGNGEYAIDLDALAAEAGIFPERDGLGRRYCRCAYTRGNCHCEGS